jgi:hypothetical protein
MQPRGGYADIPNVADNCDAHISCINCISTNMMKCFIGCSRRLNIDPPCRLNIDPGPLAAF